MGPHSTYFYCELNERVNSASVDVGRGREEVRGLPTT